MKGQSKRSFLVFSIILVLALNMFCFLHFGFVPNVYATSGTLLPSADTSVKALNPSSGTTHYLLVNDSSDSTYVNALFSVAGSYEDQYNCTDTSLTGTINNVTVSARLKKVTYYGTAKTNAAVWGIVRGGSKKTTSTTLSTTITTVSTTYATDPWTTVAWTWAGINNTDFTVTLADTTDGEFYETYGVAYEMYLVVDYTDVADTTPPTYSNVAINTTNAGQPCNFSVTLADETGLANYTFGCNSTGPWVNETVTISGTSYKANTTRTLNSTLGYVIQWKYWFADSSNNLNNTGLQSFITGAWLYGWSYRKLHIINNATGAGTNYQIKIIVVNGTGVDDNNTVYTNNNTRAYFGDVRFTDDDSFTVLDCWMETVNMGINATFWVEIADDLSTSPVTIYMYYGKSDASTTSHGASTFLYFNDFLTEIGFTRFPYDTIATVGTENGVNATGWSISSSTLLHTQQLNLTHEFALASLSNDNVAIHARVNLLTLSAPEGVGVTGRYTVASNVIACYFLRIEYNNDSYDKFRLWKDLAGAETNVGGYYLFTPTANTWYEIELRMSGSNIRGSLDGVEQIGTWDTSITSGTELGCFAERNSTRDQSFDDFWVRKYVYPEPTHGVWGGEEISPAGWSGISLMTKLTDLINNKINWTESILTVYLGTMFGKTNMVDLQNAIAASTDWKEVLQWSAQTMKFNIENETKIKWALNNATMVAGLPYTDSGSGKNDFLVYYRGLLYGYYWANNYSYLQDKWNLTTAFNNFASAYNWTGHGFLWYVNSTYTVSISYGPRYYDECAQTIACFLTFYDVCNVSEALTYAETEWAWLNNNLWNTNPTYGAPHFQYSVGEGESPEGWECEAGSFLQVIAWLKYLSPSVGNISRLMTDMSNRFIADKWYSPQWTYDTSSFPAMVIHHKEVNGQRRLSNTVTAWSSLFSMYQLFNETEIQNFQNMLNGYDTYSPAWICLYNQTGGLYDASTATFKDSSYSEPSNYATTLATTLLFFLGMTPVNATLAVPVEELYYEYRYNMFDSQIFNMSLTTRKVTVGISKNGTINFNFNESVTQMFTETGLYELTFDGYWNTITNCTKISELPTRRYFTLATALTFNPMATVNLFDSSTMLKAIGLLTSGTVTFSSGLLSNNALGFNPMATVNLFDSSTMLKAIGLLTSGIVKAFSGVITNNALGFNPTATINLFGYNLFGKEMATRFSEMVKPFENLGEWKALPFQVTGAINLFESTNIYRALAFLATGIVNFFSSLSKSMGLAFQPSVSIVPSSTNYFLKAIGFQTTATTKLYDVATMLKALGFLTDGTVTAYSSLFKAMELAFTSTGIVYPFAYGTSGKETATIIVNSFELAKAWDNAVMLKALGFQTTATTSLFDSAFIYKALGFSNFAYLNPYSTLTMNKALGFNAYELPLFFDYLSMGKAIRITTFEFLNTELIRFSGTLTMGKSVFIAFAQNLFGSLNIQSLMIPIGQIVLIGPGVPSSSFWKILAMFSIVMLMVTGVFLVEKQKKPKESQNN